MENIKEELKFTENYANTIHSELMRCSTPFTKSIESREIIIPKYIESYGVEKWEDCEECNGSGKEGDSEYYIREYIFERIADGVYDEDDIPEKYIGTDDDDLDTDELVKKYREGRYAHEFSLCRSCDEDGILSVRAKITPVEVSKEKN